MDCGGGPVTGNNDSRCLLCQHRDIHPDNIPFNTHFAGRVFYSSAGKDHRHYIPESAYANGVRPNLAACVLDWIKALAPFDAKLSADRRPPACVAIVRPQEKDEIATMNKTCSILACAIAAKSGLARDVEVSVSFDEEAWCQASRPRLDLSVDECERVSFAPENEAPEIPSIKGFAPDLADDHWSDKLDILANEDEPSPRVMSRRPIASGSFVCKNMSDHARMAAMNLLTKVEQMNLTPKTRQFLKGAVLTVNKVQT